MLEELIKEMRQLRSEISETNRLLRQLIGNDETKEQHEFDSDSNHSVDMYDWLTDPRRIL